MTTTTRRTLTLSTDTFDRVNSFSVMAGSHRLFSCSLHRGYQKSDDGILWIMNAGSMLCSSYSPEQVAERNRLNSEEPVRNGDVVEVEGELFKVRVLGAYSDCAILDKI